MQTPLLDSVVIDPVEAPQACLIWLHGLGADGHDFEPLITELGLVESHAVRVVLPHAPQRPVTINSGMVMRAWYDFPAMDFTVNQDSSGIRESERQVRALIAREIAGGIAAERILLAGFSQGGAIALHTGLRYPESLAGVMALSSYLPLADALPAEAAAANRAIPVMLAHGTQDPLLPLALAEWSRDGLQKLGYAIDWHSYPMAHAVCPQEIRDIHDWLVRRLA